MQYLCVEDCKPKAGTLGKTMFSSRKSGDLVLIQRNCCSWAPSTHFWKFMEQVWHTGSSWGGVVCVLAQEFSQRGDSSAHTFSSCILQHHASHPAEPSPCSLPNESVSWIINSDQPCKWQKSNQLLTEGSFIVSKNRPVQ